VNSYYAFADESGKEAGSKAYVLTTVIFDSEQSRSFEDRIWRWRNDSEIFSGREIKLRKLIESWDYHEEKIDAWRAIISDSSFRWFASLIPHQPTHQIQDKQVKVDVVAGLVGLNQFVRMLEAGDSQGIATFDHNIGEHNLPEMLYEAKMYAKNPIAGDASEGWRRLTGQINYADSSLVPELWIADGISYLIHRKINQHRWRSRFDELWSVIKEKVWLSSDGQLNGWGLDIYPHNDELEAEANLMIIG
jgi:hypothetical protein